MAKKPPENPWRGRSFDADANPELSAETASTRRIYRSPKDELWDLANASVNGELTSPQRERLEVLLRDNPEGQRLYVDILDMHAELHWRHRCTVPRDEELHDELFGEDDERTVRVDADEKDISKETRGVAAWLDWRAHPFRFSVLSLALTLLLWCGIGYLALVVSDKQHVAEQAASSPDNKIVAQITGKYEVEGNEPSVKFYNRDYLRAGQRLELKKGLLEVTFQGGARVVIEGPANFTVDAAGAATLAQGTLRAMVPPEAVGFTVHTPLAEIVDLGTEYGASVEADTTTSLHVLAGTVEARIRDANGQPIRSIQYVAGQAMRVNPVSREVQSLVANREVFPGEVPRWQQWELANTGKGLVEGDPDPRWKIVAAQNHPNFTPTAAFVVIGAGSYGENNPARSQWISIDPNEGRCPEGAIYTFGTQFELKDVDLSTLRLPCRVLADNQIVAVRINGKPVESLPEMWWASDGFRAFQPLVIRQGMVEGENMLEFDVRNGAPGSTAGDSPMAFRAEVYASGMNASPPSPEPAP